MTTSLHIFRSFERKHCSKTGVIRISFPEIVLLNKAQSEADGQQVELEDVQYPAHAPLNCAAKNRMAKGTISNVSQISEQNRIKIFRGDEGRVGHKRERPPTP